MLSTTALDLSLAQIETTSLIQTNLPVPPQLELAMGYKDSQRYLAVWYVPNDLAWSDGLTTCHHAWVCGWNVYAHHAQIASRFRALQQAGYTLHSAEEDSEPAYALLLDRRDRMLFLGAYPAVRAFVETQVVPSNFSHYVPKPLLAQTAEPSLNVFFGAPLDASDVAALQQIIPAMQIWLTAHT